MPIGRQEALVYLGLQYEDWGNTYMDDYPHWLFAQNWRGSVPCPSEQEILDAIRALYRQQGTSEEDIEAAIAAFIAGGTNDGTHREGPA